MLFLMRKCDEAILMYDISNRKSFEEVGKNLQFLVLNSTNEKIEIMLIGNKADLVSISFIFIVVLYQLKLNHKLKICLNSFSLLKRYKYYIYKGIHTTKNLCLLILLKKG